jgi:hypothetical protein
MAIRKTSKGCVRGQKSPRQPLCVCRPPLAKGGSEGVAERGICRAERSHGIESYSDRLLDLIVTPVPLNKAGDANGDWRGRSEADIPH